MRDVRSKTTIIHSFVTLTGNSITPSKVAVFALSLSPRLCFNVSLGSNTYSMPLSPAKMMRSMGDSDPLSALEVAAS